MKNVSQYAGVSATPSQVPVMRPETNTTPAEVELRSFAQDIIACMRRIPESRWNEIKFDVMLVMRNYSMPQVATSSTCTYGRQAGFGNQNQMQQPCNLPISSVINYPSYSGQLQTLTPLQNVSLPQPQTTPVPQLKHQTNPQVYLQNPFVGQQAQVQQTGLMGQQIATATTTTAAPTVVTTTATSTITTDVNIFDTVNTADIFQ